MYKLWCDMEQTKHDFYSSAKVDFSAMTDNEHFRSVKNMIVRTTAEISFTNENINNAETVNITPPETAEENRTRIFTDAVHGLFVSLSYLLFDDYKKEQRQLEFKVDRKLKQAICRKKQELGNKSEYGQTL